MATSTRRINFFAEAIRRCDSIKIKSHRAFQ
jgi:hypothetical protein